MISAFVFRGVPRQVILSAALQLFQPVTSESILAEIDRKLRIRFNKPDVQVRHVLRVMRRLSLITQPREAVAVCRDPKDDHILECALSGQADVIVTGDKDLLILSNFRGVRILTSRQFLDELQSPSTG